MRCTVAAITLAVIAATTGARGEDRPAFGGTWSLERAEPPVAAGASMPGSGGGGDLFVPAPRLLVITQSPEGLSVQAGAQKATFTLDNVQRVAPPGDVEGLKTRAHRDGPRLHLHFKKGQNWARDVLVLDGTSLRVVRDLESGGASTTRTLIYARESPE